MTLQLSDFHGRHHIRILVRISWLAVSHCRAWTLTFVFVAQSVWWFRACTPFHLQIFPSQLAICLFLFIYFFFKFVFLPQCSFSKVAFHQFRANGLFRIPPRSEMSDRLDRHLLLARTPPPQNVLPKLLPLPAPAERQRVRISRVG